MAEPISDERVEEIFNLADEIIRAPSRFTKDFVIQELGRGVAELAGATERARAELTELREQHQPGPSLHAWRRPDGRCVHGEQDWIRESVHVYGGEHVSMQTCSHQGEWKPVPQHPEDGDRG